MKTDRELLEQVLEKIEKAIGMGQHDEILLMEAEAALEEYLARLAQPEQEPVGYADAFGNFESDMEGWMEEEGGWFPLYIHPARTWQSLTDGDINRLPWMLDQSLLDFARAIEAKLKEKNT